MENQPYEEISIRIKKQKHYPDYTIHIDDPAQVTRGISGDKPTLDLAAVSKVREDYQKLLKNRPSRQKTRQVLSPQPLLSAVDKAWIQTLLVSFQATVESDFDSARLREGALALLEKLDPSSRVATTKNKAHLLELFAGIGIELFRLLPPQSAQVLGTAFARARRNGAHLLVRVIADENTREVLSLPWELLVWHTDARELYDRQGEFDGFVFASADATLIRCSRRRSAETAQIVGLKMPKIIVSQAPSTTPILQNKLQDILTEWEDIDVSRSWIKDPNTVQALRRCLDEEALQVVQILAHGVDAKGKRMPSLLGTGYDLLFSIRRGGITYAYRMTPYELAALLASAEGLQIVILTVCNSGSSWRDGADAVRAIAEILVDMGQVPCVVAMQGEIAQDAAMVFSREFYRHLKTVPPYKAFARARLHLLSDGWIDDWMLPVLYEPRPLAPVAPWALRAAGCLEHKLLSDDNAPAYRIASVAMAVVLLIMGLLRWLQEPRLAAWPLGWLAVGLAVWLAAGVGLATLVSSFGRSLVTIGDPDDEPVAKPFARRVLLGGFLLGYSIISWFGALFAILLSLWWPALGAGGWSAFLLALIGLGTLGGIGIGIDQLHSARGLFERYRELFTWRTTGILGIVFVAVPVAVIFFRGLGLVSHPAFYAMITGLLTIALILTQRRRSAVPPAH